MSADKPAIVIDRLDHLVLTVRDVEATCRFYADVLGMQVVRWEGRTALQFGRHKINLHQAGSEFEPKAKRPTPGSGDFCLITKTPLEAVMRHLAAQGIAIELGPVPKQGALGAMRSVYFRDPDDNLVEVSNYP
ncbi:MAG TPA: VOC family protein [Stellaceae bacterium]|nr:VOC family protein [Stellaceae bacterium]